MVFIKGYENKYSITRDGKVWSHIRNRFLKNDLRGKYFAVKLGKFGQKISVHRLVAIAYIENNEDKPYVNHIDGDRLNNHVDNLEWCTAQENIHHAQMNGLMKVRTYPVFRRDKISKDEASELCEAYATGLFTQRELAEKANISLSRVNQLIHNKWSLV